MESQILYPKCFLSLELILKKCQWKYIIQVSHCPGKDYRMQQTMYNLFGGKWRICGPLWSGTEVSQDTDDLGALNYFKILLLYYI